jgi:hypothetical protein
MMIEMKYFEVLLCERGNSTERKVLWIFNRSMDKVVGPKHVYPPKRIFTFESNNC